MKTKNIQTWQASFIAFVQPRSIAMFFLGVSAGIPLLLIFSSLSLWLREAGVDRSTVTFFSWAALAYSFKFVWAPIVGAVPLPLLSAGIGQRRAWLLMSQCSIILSIVFMASINPIASASSLFYMAFAAVCLGFSSATQDIVIDAYRIESAPAEFQALLSSVYIAGYRVGMLISGAGALYLAELLGSDMGHYNYSAWRITYFCMAITIGVGVLTTLLITEPDKPSQPLLELNEFNNKSYFQFFIFFLAAVLSFIAMYWFTSDINIVIKGSLIKLLHNTVLVDVVAGFIRLNFAILASFLTFKIFYACRWVDAELVKQSYFDPILDFFKRFSKKQVLLILLLISLYRISDIVIGVVANLFYQDLGFSKSQIAQVVKVFGLFMTLLGGFLGGAIAIRYGVIKTLFLGAILTAVTNLLFMLMANTGPNIPLFYMVISADNLAGGLASAAFIAYLSSLVNLSFTASQYAIFSSIMTLFPKILAGYSGTLVDMLGYSTFFFISALLGLPVLLVIYLLKRLN